MLRILLAIDQQHPFHLQFNLTDFSIGYVPGESDNGMFGGNSNWRGPVWMPLNFLLVQTLRQRHFFYGETLQLPYPTGSGNMASLQQIADGLAERIVSIFQVNSNGTRPVNGDDNWFYQRPENKNLVLFYEYYHGDTARGVGASHQTGWSSLVAALLRNM